MLLIRKLFTHICVICNSVSTAGLLGREKIEVHPEMGALFFMGEVSF